MLKFQNLIKQELKKIYIPNLTSTKKILRRPCLLITKSSAFREYLPCERGARARTNANGARAAHNTRRAWRREGVALAAPRGLALEPPSLSFRYWQNKISVSDSINTKTVNFSWLLVSQTRCVLYVIL